MPAPDFKDMATRLVEAWKREITDGPFLRHANCEVGSKCSQVDDELPNTYIAKALADAYQQGRRDDDVDDTPPKGAR